MEHYFGKKIFDGIAIGNIFFHSKELKKQKMTKVLSKDDELERYSNAVKQAKHQINQLYEKAVKEVGELNAQIFEVHAMMLDDDDYNDSVKSMIAEQGINAEYAVAKTRDNFVKMFENIEDEYFRSRAADIKDISERLIDILDGSENDEELTSPAIVVADDLAPSETVQMDKNMLLGFVTRHGSSNSHTAILARTMGIPAIIDVNIKEEWRGKLAILDGGAGEVIIDPDKDLLEIYQKRLAKEREQKKLLQELKGKDTETLKGRKIKLYANISNVSDLGAVIQNDASGIGLFRSEFLYLESDNFPDEEYQFKIYKQVAQTMVGKKVIIRTLDIGADKQVDYFGLAKEENPAMGYRAIRICLMRPDIFKTQLRAIFRASVYGDIAVMYPMITSLSELRRIKELVNEVKRSLDKQGENYKNIEQGIMIETPAAAIISEELAKEVDFFSIGTNDLIQYTLAVDRQNSMLDMFYNPHHPAVLRLIKYVITSAHNAGIWAGICGELGADLTLTEEFLKMGVDELSVSPGFILPVRKKIRETDI